MPLDIRTLLVSVALATAFCAGARLLLWRMHRAVPGLGQWALAGACAAVALALILSNATVAWLPSLPFAELAIGMGLALAWDGFRRFVDRPPLFARAWAVVTVVVVGAAIAVELVPSLQARSINNAVLIAAFSALIARELFAAAQPLQIAMRTTAWIYAANAVFFVIRAFLEGRGAPVAGPMNPDGLAAVSLIWWLATTIAITLGMVLMTGERLQTDLDAQVHRDPLTGALNRRAFSLIAENEMLRTSRQGRPLSVLMIDFDNFKQFNDTLGHEAGDRLLCQLVAVADQIFRGQDIFCRFGGEEFVALLPDTPADRALLAAERLREACEDPATNIAGGNGAAPFSPTLSIGVAEREAGEDVDSLLRRADAALYRAKDLGRNRCELAEGLGEDTGDEDGQPRSHQLES